MGSLTRLISKRDDRVQIADDSAVGEARRLAGSMALKAGASEAQAEEARIAATELGNNILNHASASGFVLLRVPDNAGVLEMIAVDHGAENAPQRHGLGVGLDSVRRMATRFDQYSSHGTVTLARFAFDGSSQLAAPHRGLTWGGVVTSLRSDEPSGDGWAVMPDESGCSVLLVDGLGHGLDAAVAAQTAVDAFRENYDGDVGAYFQFAHEQMRNTRGVVAAVAQIDVERRQLRFTGLGNISGKLCALGDEKGLASRGGTVGAGYQLMRPFTIEQAWHPGSCLLMWSDGLTSHVSPVDKPGLLQHDPALIAAILHRDYARQTDDAAIVAVVEGGG